MNQRQNIWIFRGPSIAGRHQEHGGCLPTILEGSPSFGGERAGLLLLFSPPSFRLGTTCRPLEPCSNFGRMLHDSHWDFSPLPKPTEGRWGGFWVGELGQKLASAGVGQKWAWVQICQRMATIGTNCQTIGNPLGKNGLGNKD